MFQIVTNAPNLELQNCSLFAKISKSLAILVPSVYHIDTRKHGASPKTCSNAGSLTKNRIS